MLNTLEAIPTHSTFPALIQGGSNLGRGAVAWGALALTCRGGSRAIRQPQGAQWLQLALEKGQPFLT